MALRGLFPNDGIVYEMYARRVEGPQPRDGDQVRLEPLISSARDPSNHRIRAPFLLGKGQHGLPSDHDPTVGGVSNKRVAAKSTGVSVAQCHILSERSRTGPVALTELSGRLEVDKGWVSRTVNGLRATAWSRKE
jgi:hypothetical protein